MTLFEIIWLVLAIVFTVAEVWAILVTRDVRNTLSWQVWMLSHRTWFRVCLFSLDSWVTWHFLIQPYLYWDTTRLFYLDWIVVAVFGYIGWDIGPPKWRARKLEES